MCDGLTMFFVECIKLCKRRVILQGLFYVRSGCRDSVLKSACLSGIVERDSPSGLGRGLLGSGNVGEGVLRISCPAVCKVFVKRWLS